MRSFLTRAALAALLLSTAAGTAFAASNHDHGRDRTSEHQGSVLNDERYVDSSDEYVSPSPVVPAPYVTSSFMTAPAYAMPTPHKARLETVMRELRTDARQIAYDHARGTLNKAEFQAVNAEKAAIRAEAIRVADAHHGAIPKMQFAGLQRQVRQLGGTIHELSTNRA